MVYRSLDNHIFYMDIDLYKLVEHNYYWPDKDSCRLSHLCHKQDPKCPHNLQDCKDIFLCMHLLCGYTQHDNGSHKIFHPCHTQQYYMVDIHWNIVPHMDIHLHILCLSKCSPPCIDWDMLFHPLHTQGPQGLASIHTLSIPLVFFFIIKKQLTMQCLIFLAFLTS